jgi:hypothetical protein
MYAMICLLPRISPFETAAKKATFIKIYTAVTVTIARGAALFIVFTGSLTSDKA